MKLLQGAVPLWKKMGKSLAEASGQTQGQDSPAGRVESSTAARTVEKISRGRLWISGMAGATPRKAASRDESSCWQNLCERIIPAHPGPTNFNKLSLRFYKGYRERRRLTRCPLRPSPS